MHVPVSQRNHKIARRALKFRKINARVYVRRIATISVQSVFAKHELLIFNHTSTRKKRVCDLTPAFCLRHYYARLYATRTPDESRTKSTSRTLLLGEISPAKIVLAARARYIGSRWLLKHRNERYNVYRNDVPPGRRLPSSIVFVFGFVFSYGNGRKVYTGGRVASATASTAVRNDVIYRETIASLWIVFHFW